MEQPIQTDLIAEISIDTAGRLCVRPSSASFPYIWREAMEVHWDADGGFLYSPAPREWSYADWFRQIARAAREQGCILKLGRLTRWREVPVSVRGEIEEAARS